MGVMSRKSGKYFIITSDRIPGDLPSKQAPKKPIVDVFQVWNGNEWSTDPATAVVFPQLDAADDYIRANFARVIT